MFNKFNLMFDRLACRECTDFKFRYRAKVRHPFEPVHEYKSAAKYTDLIVSSLMLGTHQIESDNIDSIG